MVSCVRMFTYNHRMGIMFLMARYPIFLALNMVLSKPLVLGLNFASMVTTTTLLTSAHDPMMFFHLSAHGRNLLLYIDDMIIIGDDPEYIAFVKTHLSEQFLMFDPSSLLSPD